MKGKEKTKEQLMDELARLRHQITELQKSEIKHQQIEEDLTESEKKYRTLIELIDVGIQIETVEGRILECNTAAAKIYGYTKKEMIDLTLADLVPEEFAKKIPKVVTEKEATQGIFVSRISKKKDGTIFPTEIATKIVNIGGKPRLIVYVRDITRRKKAEKKLRKARKMFTSLFNSSPEALVYEDEKSSILNINRRFTELFGYTLEELKGRNIDEGMIYPIDKREEGLRLTRNVKGFSNYETIRKRKDGTLIQVSISSSPVIVNNQLRGFLTLYKDITERKEAEKMIIHEQNLLHALMDNISDSIYFKDEKNRFIRVNKVKAGHSGRTPEEMIGKTDFDFFQKEIAKQSFADDNYVMESGKSIIDKIEKIIYLDKTEHWVSITKVPWYIKEGKIIGTIGISRDITERQKILEKLKESEEKYCNLFENMPGAYYRTDREGNLIMINPEGAKLFGYNFLEDILGKNIAQYFYFAPEERKKYLKELEKNKGNLKDFELTLKKKDGTLLVISDTSHFYYNKEGDLAGVEGIFVDITERKKVEKAIVYEQNLLHALMDNIPDFIYFKDEKNRFVRVNKASGEDRGVTPEDFIGKTDFDIFTEEAAKKCFADDDRVMKTGKPLINRIEKITYLDGMERWFSATKVPRYDEKGKIIGTIGITRNITERQKVLEKLKQSQQEFASLFMNSPEALAYLDSKSDILSINPRFTELFGYTLEEVKGRNINDGMIHPPDKIEEGKNFDKIALNKGYFNYETIRKKKDGTCFPVSISGSNMVIDGQVKGIIGTYVDITERKKMEQELERLAHYDVLTGCCSRGYGLNLLEQQIKTARRKKLPILLLYLDIDKFKEINDTYGHKEGNLVLKEVAMFFKSTLREIDIICRIGGDEFLLISPDSSLNDAPLVRERINKNLEKLNQKLAKPYKIDFSIGLSYYNPFNPLSIEELIKIADENMYEEKKKKKEGK